jgi:hypothetical protein
MKVDKLIRELEKHKAAIAKHRDSRDLMEDVENICVDSDEAHEALEHAIEVLSKGL